MKVKLVTGGGYAVRWHATKTLTGILSIHCKVYWTNHDCHWHKGEMLGAEEVSLMYTRTTSSIFILRGDGYRPHTRMRDGSAE